MHLKAKEQGATTLERVAILHSNCYIGRNISEFADTVENIDDISMLITGHYNIAPLIDYYEPLIVPTVMDIESYVGENVKGKYSRAWIPIVRTRKIWCNRYGAKYLRKVYPDFDWS